MRRAHKANPDALVIVTGCYAELKKEKLYDIEGVSRVFTAAEKPQLVDETLAMLQEIPGQAGNDGNSQAGNDDLGPEKAHVMPGPDRASVETLPAYSSGERTRSFLKVQDGCNNFCAYCTVPYARGRSRNIPICELVKQAEQIAAKGIREVVLTGVNTGDFGRTTGESFLDLLKALNAVDGIDRYRISSIEPNLITEEIVDWIASGTKFQRHFHIPLQSGSDTLLKKVGRRYDTALFASRIDYIRQAMERPGEPKVFFGIDVIVGLPGETEELFQETYHFLKDRIKPAFLHVFPYSKRPGTRAAVMPDQVQDSVKTERVARLEALSEELHAAFVAANKGLPERVLWESSVKDGMMFGYTGNYIRVEKPYDPALVNTLENMVI
jgi:threonylcarbamoyladenosine tRNA methylthiotransferase MtaB